MVTELNAENFLPTTSHLLAYVTFGRDIAQFDLLIQFLTWLSVILWTLVIFTTMLRASAHVTHIRHVHKNRKTAAHDALSAPNQSTEKKRHGYS